MQNVISALCRQGVKLSSKDIMRCQYLVRITPNSVIHLPVPLPFTRSFHYRTACQTRKFITVSNTNSR